MSADNTFSELSELSYYSDYSGEDMFIHPDFEEEEEQEEQEEQVEQEEQEEQVEQEEQEEHIGLFNQDIDIETSGLFIKERGSLDLFLLSDFVTLEPSGLTMFTDLVENYKFWCKFNGYQHLNCSPNGPIIEELRKRCCTITKKNYHKYKSHIYIRGISLC